MVANLLCNLWNSYLYGNEIFVYRWLGQAKRPRLSAIVGGVLPYILCAILDGYGIAMHYACKCGQSFRRFRAAQEVYPWLRIPVLFEELLQSSAGSCALLGCTSDGHSLAHQLLLIEALPICGLLRSWLCQCTLCDTLGAILDIYSSFARVQRIRLFVHILACVGKAHKQL